MERTLDCGCHSDIQRAGAVCRASVLLCQVLTEAGVTPAVHLRPHNQWVSDWHVRGERCVTEVAVHAVLTFCSIGSRRAATTLGVQCGDRGLGRWPRSDVKVKGLYQTPPG